MLYDYVSESSEPGTSDFSISSTETDGSFIPTSKRRGTSATSTTTLQRAGTTSNRGTNRPAFYLQGNRALQSETPPSHRWTQGPRRSRTSCPNCGVPILMSSLLEETQSVPTLSRSNAVVGNTPPTSQPTVSSYRGRFKTGWTQNLTKRLVDLPAAPLHPNPNS
jgi:hypothetical protein